MPMHLSSIAFDRILSQKDQTVEIGGENEQQY